PGHHGDDPIQRLKLETTPQWYPRPLLAAATLSVAVPAEPGDPVRPEQMAPVRRRTARMLVLHIM
ncbi:MAG: hypothetical protein M3509_11485, partial [Chloroflexota bacterium]|nr:hypothetical protein [Chloroflexota bacterium]